MAFKDFLERIKNVGADLVTLDVLTMSGSIKLKLSGDKIDFNDLVKSLQQQVTKADGTVYVVSYTRVDLDKDMLNFVKEGLNEAETEMVKAHESMLKTAQEARFAFINFVRSTIAGIGG